ncbi:MAG: class I SAM-dependent methyltransferase [Bacteroidales bacterium]|jgi:23S rRNA (cytosine1962-C5)-methyltransferase|nr:class I SAM-dependent methyltransferase [Bacteroidales bacterium]
MIIESPGEWPDYELIDSGGFEKLERFGSYVLVRPEPKALWRKSLSDEKWESMVNTEFVPGAGFARAGKEDSGTWKMIRKMPEQWQIGYPSFSRGKDPDFPNFKLRLGLTSFKHVGVFPEQAPNWDFIYKQTGRILNESGGSCEDRKSGKKVPRILNLFAYTGAASLAAKAAGADVVHLDSVRQVVSWAKENMQLSGLDNIRWVVEDASKFVKREVRRGNIYDGIILDPPAYGHGPGGERWKLDELLFDLLCGCARLLAPSNSFMVLNLYSNGYSALLADTAVKAAMDCGGGKEGADFSCGELVLKDGFGKALPLSVFSRVIR